MRARPPSGFVRGATPHGTESDRLAAVVAAVVVVVLLLLLPSSSPTIAASSSAAFAASFSSPPVRSAVPGRRRLEGEEDDDGLPSKERRALRPREDEGEAEAEAEEEERRRRSSATSSSSAVCLRFSRSFQRHVAYRPRRGRTTTSPHPSPSICRYDDECDEVLRSFAFLDEAREAYPNARLADLPEAATATAVAAVPTGRDDSADGGNDGDGRREGEEEEEEEEEEDHRLVLSGVGLDGIGAYRGAPSSDGLPPPGGATRGAGKVPPASTNPVVAGVSSSSSSAADDEALRYLASLAWTCFRSRTPPDSDRARLERRRIASVLSERVGRSRLDCHNPASIRRNYDRIMDLLTRGRRRRRRSLAAARSDGDGASGDASPPPLFADWTNAPGLAFDEAGARNVVANFPQVCLYEYRELEERVGFLNAPVVGDDGRSREEEQRKKGRRGRRARRPAAEEVDWPRLSWKGRGAGLTLQQATEAIRDVPQLLATYHEDAQKPSILYFYQQLRVPYDLCDEARVELSRHLTGADPSDVCAFAHLRTLGVRWDQMNVLLSAFPTLTFCDTEPGWELFDHGPVRAALDEGSMRYLRKRLQVGPMEVFGMIKTHTRLASYHVSTKIAPTLDALEARLGFTSRELRKVVLRMPSLIGMAVGDKDDEGGPSVGLNERLDFFRDEAHVGRSDLKRAVLKQPSLLQYSVDSSLRPKLRFFLDDLSIPPSSMSKVISTAPAVMGLSLSRNLRPKVQALTDICALSPDEVGAIVANVPSILALSLKQKIEPCLAFLAEALGLRSEAELGELVRGTPRVLMHGIETSLAPKLKMIEEALEEERAVRGSPDGAVPAGDAAGAIVVRNPALLVTTNKILSTRLRNCLLERDKTLREALRPRSEGRVRSGETQVERHDRPANLPLDQDRTRRQKRLVWELAPDSTEVVRTYPSVQAVAEVLDASPSRVYGACRRGTLLKGHRFAYANSTSSLQRMQTPERTKRPESTSAEWARRADLAEPLPTVPSAFPRRTRMPDFEPLQIFSGGHRSPPEASPTDLSVVIFASGSVFPADSSNVVRGTRRAGGLALYVPQVQRGGAELSERLRLAAESSFGTIVPESEGGSRYADGLILVGFPFLRPSRNRCGLCACHDALKVVLHLLKQAAARVDLGACRVRVDVWTDSSYAWNLLRDKDRLFDWGAYERMDDFVYDGDGPRELANPDLLYPLARTYHRLVSKDVGNVDGKILCIGNSVDISFLHSGCMRHGDASVDYVNRVNDFAQRAASWQFDRSKRL